LGLRQAATTAATIWIAKLQSHSGLADGAILSLVDGSLAAVHLLAGLCAIATPPQ
jgi:hypothetical protein